MKHLNIITVLRSGITALAMLALASSLAGCGESKNCGIFDECFEDSEGNYSYEWGSYEACDLYESCEYYGDCEYYPDTCQEAVDDANDTGESYEWGSYEACDLYESCEYYGDCEYYPDSCQDDAEDAEDAEEVFSSEVTAFESFHAQTVRWEATELSFDSAELLTEAYTAGDEVISLERVFTLTGTVKNRLEETTGFDPAWVLILADGSRIWSSQVDSTRLEPEESGPFQVSFELPEDSALEGALIEPSNSSDAGEKRLLRVPLDRAFESPYPYTIDELQSLEMKTLNDESATQWEMTVLNAEVTLNTDHRRGQRPDYGMKFIELTIQADLVSASSNANFGDRDFELLVDGFSVHGDMDGEILVSNQRATDRLVFEIEEEVTEFEFLYDMAHPGVPDETQRLMVKLPVVEE